MTEHRDKVEQRRFQIFKERTDLPTLEARAEWDYMLKRYQVVRLLKSLTTKEKRMR